MDDRRTKSWGARREVDSSQRALAPPGPGAPPGPPGDRSRGPWPPPLRRYPLSFAIVGFAAGVYAVQLALGGATAGGALAGVDALAGTPIAFVLLSPFLHGTLGHLGWNAGVFLALGPALEVRLRPPVFLAGVVGAGWVTNVAPAVLPGGTVAGIGLSGATHAVAMAVFPFALDAAIRGRGRRRAAAAGGLVLIASMAVGTFLLALGVVPPGTTAVQAHVAGLALGSVASLAVAPQFAPDQWPS